MTIRPTPFASSSVEQSRDAAVEKLRSMSRHGLSAALDPCSTRTGMFQVFAEFLV